jgi:hypothetical protein
MSSEKKRFKLNGAVVNHSVMDLPMAEQCVDVAQAAIRDHYTEHVSARPNHAALLIAAVP